MSNIKDIIPWWAKIAGKIVLSRIHFPYELWRRLGVFQHGFMLDPNYATSVFLRHYERFRSQSPTTFSMLELGPGDSLSTALLGASYGASQILLVDVGPFAERDVTKYAPLQKKLGVPWASQQFSDIEEMLTATNTTYLTNGLGSLRTIPDASVDFVFSQAVLEHVSLYEFEATMTELFRIQLPGSIASHRIDLQDHLSHSLNSLRFSEQRWESPLFVNSGFYTNRLRSGQIIEIMKRVGYIVTDYVPDMWKQLPIDKSKLAQPFASMSEDNLIVRGMDIILRKPQ